MRRPSAIDKDASEITVVQGLTSVFESIASTQVAKVKNNVELSKDFFQLLWQRYTSLRIDPASRLTYRNQSNSRNPKTVFVIVSAEAGLSGDIDNRLIDAMLRDYDAKTTDIVVLGSHGAQQLTQHNIAYEHFFTVPETDRYIDVSPVIAVIKDYARIVVYYEEYLSLAQQGIRSMDLISSLREMSQEAEEDAMTTAETIFEPSLDEIAEEMEASMMSLGLSQAILESGLAQAASRFNAMAVAKKRATELLTGYRMEYHRAKRSENDRELREILISLKEKRKRTGARR